MMKRIVRGLSMTGVLALGVASFTGSAVPAARPAKVVTHGWTTGKVEPLLPIVGTDPTGTGSVVGPCTPVPGCACSVVHVSCGDTGGDQFGGSTDACNIVLDPATCQKLGIVPVASTIEGIDYVPIDPACWLDPINAIPDFTGIGQIEAYCLAQHEARHACEDAHFTERCAMEQNGYAQALACLNRIYDAKCNELGPDDQAGYCHDLQVTIGVNQGIWALEQCLCETSSSCDQCIAVCQGQGAGFEGDDEATINLNCDNYGNNHACDADDRP